VLKQQQRVNRELLEKYWRCLQELTDCQVRQFLSPQDEQLSVKVILYRLLLVAAFPDFIATQPDEEKTLSVRFYLIDLGASEHNIPMK